MFVPWRALNGCHKNTEMCRSGVDKKRQRLAEAEVRDSAEMASEVYGEQLQTVSRFKYLGRIFTRFPATADQSSSPSVKILLRYLNQETVCSCSP